MRKQEMTTNLSFNNKSIRTRAATLPGSLTSNRTCNPSNTATKWKLVTPLGTNSQVLTAKVGTQLHTLKETFFTKIIMPEALDQWA